MVTVTMSPARFDDERRIPDCLDGLSQHPGSDSLRLARHLRLPELARRRVYPVSPRFPLAHPRQQDFVVKQRLRTLVPYQGRHTGLPAGRPSMVRDPYGVCLRAHFFPALMLLPRHETMFREFWRFPNRTSMRQHYASKGGRKPSRAKTSGPIRIYPTSQPFPIIRVDLSDTNPLDSRIETRSLTDTFVPSSRLSKSLAKVAASSSSGWGWVWTSRPSNFPFNRIRSRPSSNSRTTRRP